MIVLLCILTSLMLLAVLISPFFLGSGGILSYTSTIRDIAKLKVVKTSILKEYLLEEARAKHSEISKRVWLQRQNFLFNRYADIARQMDSVREKGVLK